MDKNKKTALNIIAFIIGMICLTYAAVPFYSVFCKATGFGGTTQRVRALSKTEGQRTVTVQFDANVDSSVPWNFKPVERSVTVKTGENKLVAFQAENLSNETITGTATFNVTPVKVGQYFNKIQCFCFTKQTLGSKETKMLPVTFYIDPAMEKDPEMDDVSVITLSYTFFKVK